MLVFNFYNEQKLCFLYQGYFFSIQTRHTLMDALSFFPRSKYSFLKLHFSFSLFFYLFYLLFFIFIFFIFIYFWLRTFLQSSVLIVQQSLPSKRQRQLCLWLWLWLWLPWTAQVSKALVLVQPAIQHQRWRKTHSFL